MFSMKSIYKLIILIGAITFGINYFMPKMNPKERKRLMKKVRRLQNQAEDYIESAMSLIK